MTNDEMKALKRSARMIVEELKTLGYAPISHTHMLTALSKTSGFEGWNAIRQAVTRQAKSEKARLPYPSHYKSATYQTTGLMVDVVRWEDPERKLGYGYYCYDADTGLCLTPFEDLLFKGDEVPSYEEVSDLVTYLESYSACEKCGLIQQEDPGQCFREGCRGLTRAYLPQI